MRCLSRSVGSTAGRALDETDLDEVAAGLAARALFKKLHCASASSAAEKVSCLTKEVRSSIA